MQCLYAVGESLLDVVFRDNEVLSARPGGSMLNSSVSCGRMGMDVRFITEMGNDPTGRLINEFLERNGVKLEYSSILAGRTKIAMAFLDRENNADYSFYPGTIPVAELSRIPSFDPGDYLLFGSFYALDPWCRSKIARLLTEAKKGGATIFYDPNFRKPHASELQKVRPALLQNIGHADLVRGSHEDFLNLFGQDDAQSVYRLLAGNGCEVVVYTRGNGTLELYAPSIQRQYEVPVVRTASTIGAGDSFNAGLLYSLSHLRITRGDLHSLDGKIWDRIIGTAISFATHVCQRYENYVAPDFIPPINHKSP